MDHIKCCHISKSSSNLIGSSSHHPIFLPIFITIKYQSRSHLSKCSRISILLISVWLWPHKHSPMPGTIHVSVLEFMGVSSSDPSAAWVRVSMGRRSSETRDTGDFTFPIVKLSEDLVVALVDGEGNEIANTGIRTMQIIQKGTWDEKFSFDRGGHVHLKLRFSLNEDEKNRIRVMRESAMKKNLDTTSTINLIRSGSTSSTRDSEEASTQSVSDSLMRFRSEAHSEIEGSLADSSMNSDASSVGSTTSYQKGEESGLASESPVPVEMLSSAFSGEMEAESSRVSESLLVEKSGVSSALSSNRSAYQQEVSVAANVQDEPITKLPYKKEFSVAANVQDEPITKLPYKKEFSVAANVQDDPVLKGEDRDPAKKTPSNVKKMISAFETGQNQSVKSLKRESPVQQLSSVDHPGSLKDQVEKITSQSNDESLKKKEDTVLTEDLQPNVTSVGGQVDVVQSDTEQSSAPSELDSSVTRFYTRSVHPMEVEMEEKNEPLDILTRQSAAETATSSGRMYGEQADFIQSDTKQPLAQTELESNIMQSESRSIDPGEVSEEKKDKSLDDLTRQSAVEAAISSARTNEERAESVPSDTEQSLVPSELESNVTQFDSTSIDPSEISVEEDSNKSSIDLTRQSTSESATSSGRIYEEIQAYYSSDSSDAERRERKKDGGFEVSQSIVSESKSDQKPASSIYYREGYDSHENGIWIFPHSTERLCITTAGSQAMKLIELQHIEANPCQDMENSLEDSFEKRHGLHKTEVSNLPKPGSGSSPDDSCNGLAGQALKVAVILGFGALVFLSRKKKLRMKKRHETGAREIAAEQ